MQHRNCLCATQKLSLFYREHIVSGQKLAKNQELAKIGRRATVLRFAGMGEHPTGLRKPLGLFLDPKNGQFFFFAPLAPLLGGALKGRLHWSMHSWSLLAPWVPWGFHVVQPLQSGAAILAA